MNDTLRRELTSRAARLGLASLLLACAAGLFYVGYVAWRSGGGDLGSDGRHGAPTGLPIFAFGAALAVGGLLLTKQAVLPDEADDEPCH